MSRRELGRKRRASCREKPRVAAARSRTTSRIASGRDQNDRREADTTSRESIRSHRGAAEARGVRARPSRSRDRRIAGGDRREEGPLEDHRLDRRDRHSGGDRRIQTLRQELALRKDRPADERGADSLRARKGGRKDAEVLVGGGSA